MSMYRPPTGSKPARLPSGRGVPTGAFRMGTGKRPGSRVGGLMTMGGSLNSQITIPDRPVTQQGLGGMKTGVKGPVRQVQDKSYYLGILRSKIGELNNEVIRLSQELEQLQQDSATYITYEKRAETLATEVDDLRGQLADYNTLIDKLNTDTELGTIMADYDTLCRQNEVESRAIDVIFGEKQKAEMQINQLEASLEQEKKFTDTLVESMDMEVQEKYQQLKMENQMIKENVKEKEEELERLTVKADNLEEELASSDLKQQAFYLHQQLQEVVAKRDDWRSKEDETPEQERERLLKQVKQDNQEIASLEKRANELQDTLERAQDALRKIDSDIEESQGDRVEKLRGLLAQEKVRKEFVENYEPEKKKELERIRKLEENIIGTLDHISQTMAQSENLPSATQMQEMQEDLMFKEEEMKRAAATAESLEQQNARLVNDLIKIEELEEKIRKELLTIKQEIQSMTEEVKVFADLDRLQIEEEEKKRSLLLERDNLLQRKEVAKENYKPILQKFNSEKSQLEKNDTFTQLENLEKKLQYLEQNNFVMKEYIATRLSEGNYKDVAKLVMDLQQQYNSMIVKSL